MILPILIGIGAWAIGATVVNRLMEADYEKEQAAKIRRAADDAVKREAQARQRRQKAQVDGLVSQFGLPHSIKPKLPTLAAGGDDGIRQIERALADGTSATADKLRNHDKRRRELLELRNEVCKVRFLDRGDERAAGREVANDG